MRRARSRKQGLAVLVALSKEGGVRILLALAVMMLAAAPAFAGNKHHGNNDNKIAKLQDKIDHVLVTPSDDRRKQIDQLEQKLGFFLFQRNIHKDDF